MKKDARSTALAVLDSVARSDTLATAVIRKEAEKFDLPPETTALANQLVMGVLRNRTFLDSVLSRAVEKSLPTGDRRLLDVMRLAAFEMLFLDAVPDYATVSAFVNLARATKGPRIGGFVNAVLRKLSTMDRHQLRTSITAMEPEGRFSMPPWIISTARKAFGESWQQEMEALNSPAAIGIHVNPFLNTTAQLVLELADSGIEASTVPGMPLALTVSHKNHPYQTPAFVQGKFWPQDLASHLVAQLASSHPGPLWLDGCCGLGTKTLALAARRQQGSIHASDPNAGRIEALQKRWKALRFPASVSPSVASLLDLSDNGSFDMVLVDAPCSGLGTLRHHPEIRWRRTLEDIERNSRLQAKLLNKAAGMLNHGAMLVYAVCSFAPEEGPRLVQSFLQQNPRFSPSNEARNEMARINDQRRLAGLPEILMDEAGGISLPPTLLNSDAFYAAFLQG